ncbi:hypothetical protein EIP91_006617 [Steccherinum ochraceum]|uniref:Uncharacterized protein n=1 Tax=Steccherinum ochraceum TaxID=92696 RepID=A0A4R0R860_9APHY|nr:hypothetical protein EIP91_006617 [Steccherinum ochraceum]
MWIAHYAQGLIAKPFAPRVPLIVLALAGAAPDAAFFLMQFVGIETFNFDKTLVKKGCFPYTNDYPYSHSLVGMAAVGVAIALFYKMFARVYASPKDLAVIVATSASHFLLEWPSHREDIQIIPHDDKALGASLFDSPSATFIIEITIFLLGFGIYASFAPMATQAGFRNNPGRVQMTFLFMVVQQAMFCFGSAPTLETRWVHGPLFLAEILWSCWLLGKLDAQSAGAIPDMSHLKLSAQEKTITVDSAKKD